MPGLKARIALALALTLAVPAAFPAHAANSQFNVSADQFVTLTYDFIDKAFFRINQNADLSGKAFTIPSGKTLVITDVAWAFDGGTPGSTAGLQLNLKWSGDENPVFVATTVVNQDFRGGLNQHLTGGLVLKSGGSGKVVPLFSGGVNSTALILQGFLQ